ncbi:MAG: amidohydrolase family protein [Pseudomonadota bacterium]
MHAHFYGGGLAALLTRRETAPYLRVASDGTRWMGAMNGEFPFSADYDDADAVLAQMDAQGISHRLITFPGALGVDLLPVDTCETAICAFNDHLAALGAQSSNRLIGLAGLPLADMDRARAELRRVRRALNLPGVILPGNYFLSLAEMEALRPILAEADAHGCHVMVHPGLKVGQSAPPPPSDHPQYRLSAVALQSSIADMALTLVLSDAVSAYPNVSFQVVNLGGTLPFIVERITAIAAHRNPNAPFPLERLRALWFDTASLGPNALRAAIALYGSARIMLGSDFPIFKGNPGDTVDGAGLDPATRAAISHGNAERLLRGLGWRG